MLYYYWLDYIGQLLVHAVCLVVLFVTVLLCYILWTKQMKTESEIDTLKIASANNHEEC